MRSVIMPTRPPIAAAPAGTERAGHEVQARTGLVPLLLVCGILSPAIYIGADILAANRYPGFSYTDQAVSELFAIGAPTSGLVVPLFTLSSALLLVFAIGVWRSAAHRRSLQVVAAMFALSAIDALILWNLFPMHARGEARTMTDTMHLVFATNPWVSVTLIGALIAFRNWFRWYTIATFIAILALAIYGFSFAPAVAANGPTPLMGLAERMGQYTYGVWEMALAGVLLRERGSLQR